MCKIAWWPAPSRREQFALNLRKRIDHIGNANLVEAPGRVSTKVANEKGHVFVVRVDPPKYRLGGRQVVPQLNDMLIDILLVNNEACLFRVETQQPPKDVASWTTGRLSRPHPRRPSLRLVELETYQLGVDIHLLPSRCAFRGICAPQPEVVAHSAEEEPRCFLIDRNVHPKEYNLPAQDAQGKGNRRTTFSDTRFPCKGLEAGCGSKESFEKCKSLG